MFIVVFPLDTTLKRITGPNLLVRTARTAHGVLHHAVVRAITNALFHCASFFVLPTIISFRQAPLA
jgi:hypothetical protein